MKTTSRKGARLGQHFLIQPAIAKDLAEASQITRADTVLEIGPGRGILTRALLAHAGRVVAVEKDSALVAHLQTIFASEIARGTLTLIEGDVRDFDSAQLNAKEYILAANIPYYITGDIMRRFLNARAQPKTMALLVQKEVAKRIARAPKESLLSLSVKAFGKPHYVRTVPAGNFNPPPSVDSAILVIEHISRDFFRDLDKTLFFTVLHAGFAAKRKQLAGNLSTLWSRTAVVEALSACGLPTGTRAEDVTLEVWKQLIRRLGHPSGSTPS